jgi:WD40 repeat protein/serine/threonine protein kinase
MAEADDHSTTDPPSDATALWQGNPQVLSVGGGYRLLQLLGRGAFGEVWRAEAPGGVEVAIKLVTRSVKGTEAERELEALQLIKRLRHHNLLSLQAFFPLPDRLVIVLELADGSLRSRYDQCREGGLPGIPTPELIRYIREAAEALDYLHKQQVQHRDVKPDNILLLGQHVKVADFGLAKLVEQSLLQNASHAGTPAYMAPEVWNNQLSVHSDQYSLAAMYAEMRSGCFPFARDSLASLMRAHLLDPPDLASLGPRERQVVAKALAKEPDQRYPNCIGFVKLLVEALLADQSATAPTQRRPAKKRPVPSSNQATLPPAAKRTPTAPTPKPVAASQTEPIIRVRKPAPSSSPWVVPVVTLGAFSLATGLLIGGLIVANRKPVPRSSQHARTDRSSGEPTEPEAPREVQGPAPAKRDEPAPKPAEPEPSVGLIRSLQGHEGEVWGVAFAADGQLALSGSGDKSVRLWDLTSGTMVRQFLGHTAGVMSVALSPDGRRALSGSADHSVRLWDVATGQQLFRLDGHTSSVETVAFSADGRRALSGGQDRVVCLWDVDSGVRRQRFREFLFPVWSVAFAPDGRSALVGTGTLLERAPGLTLWLQPLEDGDGRWAFADYSGSVKSVAFSPDGKRAVSGSADGTVRLWNVASRVQQMEIVSASGKGVYGVAFSPLGDRVLSCGIDRTVRLWAADSGAAVQQFSEHLSAVWSVAFAPDGRRALSCGGDGMVRLWQLPK